MINNYLSCGPADLSALTVYNPLCGTVDTPALSQIAGLLLLPNAAPRFDWTDAEDVAEKTDNELAGNNTGKFVLGVGGMTQEPVIVNLGRSNPITPFYNFEIQHRVALGRCGNNYNLLNGLHSGWRGFRFWAYTVGDRFIGGNTGIAPTYVRVTMPLGSGRGDHEIANLIVGWKADADAGRRYLPGLFDGTQATTPTDTQMATQEWNAQATNVLTWTANGGDLPTPYLNRVWGFCNGVKMNGTLGDYSISQGTGSATITINSSLHVAGNNYIFHAFLS